MSMSNTKKYYKVGISHWKSQIYRNMFPLKFQEFIDCSRQKYFYGNSNILFFHVPKVAGRSFNKMLYNKSDTLHITAKNYLKYFHRHLTNNFSFAMMRCPVERLVSSFFFLKSGGTNYCRVGYKSIYSSEIFDSVETFIENYLDNKGDLSLDHVLMPQHYYFSASDEILVDHVGILDKVNTTLDILSKYSNNILKLPHKNKTIYSYKIKLSKRHKEIIKNIYAKDLEIYSKLKCDHEIKS